MKILFVQPDLNPPGGGNAVAAWMIESLKDVHEITVLTWCPVDLPLINRMCGTSLSANDIRCVEARPWAWLMDHLPLPLGLLRSNLLLRECRRMAAHYDLVMTANNESDLGPPGIQYVHYPKFDSERPGVDLRWHHPRWALHGYYAFCRWATGFSFERMRHNRTLVNSDYIGERFRGVHGHAAVTLHPPALGVFAPRRWEERASAFVCIGRISPEKRIETIVEILAEVRAHHPTVHLHIAGQPNNDSYCASVRRMADQHREWMHLHEDLSRTALSELISQQRYGIHAMEGEHFGMAVAELVAAGCVVFAPHSGGQIEVLGACEALLYADRHDAVRKIRAVLDDAALERRLRADLDQRREHFSIERFSSAVTAAVDEFAAGEDTQRASRLHASATS